MSRESWHVPEQREPGVLYMHGHPGTNYAAVAAIEVDGQRFERVRTCEIVWCDESYWTDCGMEHDGTYECTECHGELPESLQDAWEYYLAGHGEKPFSNCPNCGAKVVSADD